MGRESKKKELIANLPKVYDLLSRTHHISLGDFPNLAKMQECLAVHDFSKFSSLQPRLIKAVDEMLSSDIAKLMQMIPQVSGSSCAIYSISLLFYTNTFGLNFVDGSNIILKTQGLFLR